MMATDGILDAYYASSRVLCKLDRGRREPPAAPLFRHEEHVGVGMALGHAPRGLDDAIDDDAAPVLVDRLDVDQRLAVGSVVDDGAIVVAEELREELRRRARAHVDDDGRIDHPPFTLLLWRAVAQRQRRRGRIA